MNLLVLKDAAVLGPKSFENNALPPSCRGLLWQKESLSESPHQIRRH